MPSSTPPAVWRRGWGLALLAALSACAPATPPPSATRAHPAIVSLNPCSDAILAEVADPGQVLALSHYSRDPRSSSMDVALARRFPATRGTVEEVLALHPDLVLGDTFLGPAARAAYDRLGIPVTQLPIAMTVADSRAQVRRIAALAGHPERGERLVARIDAALATAAPPAGTAPVPTVVWQSGGIVPGEGTLIADLLRHTGFASFSAARGMRQADVLPLERMLADPPRLILIASDAHGDGDRRLHHPVLAALDGTRRETLAPGLLYCGGPTIIRAAARLRQVRASL